MEDNCQHKKSTSHDRRVVAYLKPKNEVLFDGFVSDKGVSQSEAINLIVKDYFNRIPVEEKNKYLRSSSKSNLF